MRVESLPETAKDKHNIYFNIKGKKTNLQVCQV